MKLVRTLLLLGALSFCSAMAVEARGVQGPAVGLPEVQQAAPVAAGQISFSFVPRVPGQTPWTITVGPDGKGIYTERLAGAVDQPLRVGEVTWSRLQAGTQAVEKGRCETKAKGIAQTGEKTFAVGTTSCKFNYSDDDALNESATAFLALAETLHVGAKLKHDHKFDKLALDADMESLMSQVDAGRALEPGNVAPILQSLVDDEHVIDRVRRKAARLLQTATPDKTR